MADHLSFAQLYIDGLPVDGASETLGVEDPAHEEIFTTVPTASLAQVDAAIEAARRAFDRGPWSRQPARERAATLARMADALAARHAELVETAIRETGSTALVARWAQVDMALEHARALPELFATLPDWEHNELPLADSLDPTGRDVVLSIRRYEPCGVVAAITPYNFPLQTSVWKVFSALAAGCSVVLRPSPLTPITALALGAAAREAGLPPGTLNVVVEAGSAGAELLTADRRVDCVSFTGSTDVGRRIAAQAAPTVKRVVLELGGKSVALYLPDALGPGGLESGVATVFGSMAGQGCALQTRVLVPRENLADAVERVAGVARSLRVGHPRDPETAVGPVISAAQRDRIERLVAAGVDAGGKLVAGGDRPAHLDVGYYVAPTVLLVDDNRNPAAQREAFGPVVTIQGYDDLDQAVDIANDSDYGLSGGIYTGDLKLGLSVAERIRSGTVQVNRGIANAYTPMGGVKQSGIGRERGVAGFREYQELKHVVVAGAR
ncbi:aldehyde dehydrogenase family protein [Frankia sp. CNm7]|uniref:Aldehyde dehydrogenase family protein n=1 Tax=Frankia nepalensis TaxID=1836974 RepID=A0A937UR30_9ACTN|nr:aldehyde dehydrogenase family protein [Frankia nepalensis]MBL7496384.1 aldehyde dehydrogenase family protein [Frankia nepalensis]MBL7511466.1 aldehyde dehydrogenase family protein [Frankia nepalensis]MBL7523872.1 aldehyde dehydrogenase family protein [Frankia nepalensis]MBL7627331.1 aldehyde dehydrogenase family protein [Frankia nepalensis]